jgi:hypothetical protein
MQGKRKKQQPCEQFACTMSHRRTMILLKYANNEASTYGTKQIFERAQYMNIYASTN